MRIASYVPRTGVWSGRLEALAAEEPGHEFILEAERADTVIENDGTPAELESKLATLLEKFESELATGGQS
ncbi:MAG TPA: hypothetical protein PKD47_11800 [Solirubrobacterales bacterium]|nr:hypothetical protein [Solirubrobacterales bacterium]